MLFTDNLKNDLVAIVVSLLVVITVAYFKWSLGYWKRRGIESPKPSIPFGNTTDLFLARKAFGEVWKDIYFQLKSKGIRHGGAYVTLKPFYVPIDLEIVKNILQNDFHHFTGHGLYVNEDTDPLSVNLFSLEGEKWRTTRAKLTPAFTSGKMKMMIQALIECSYGLNELLDDACNKNCPIDIKDVMGRFATDVIGSCAFGIECNSMKNPDSDFRKYGLLAIDPGILGTMRSLLQLLVPHEVLGYLKFKSHHPQVINFFVNVVKETITFRERNNINRKDFMQLLIQLKNEGKLLEDGEINGKKEESNTSGVMTVNEIAAQCFLFFLAGFETSSTTLNFAIYEIAVNPTIQHKLREEINTVLKKYDNKITYDGVMEMTYLEKVLCAGKTFLETLRKYPPFPELFRFCNKDYRVPGTDVIIEKGINVVIPILGIHRDPEYYPNPDKFDPERFSEENKAKRPPFSWLPFGEGPRICIGLRFGKLLSKIGIITLLRHYKITLNKKTRVPMVFKKLGIVSASEGGIWIHVHKLYD